MSPILQLNRLQKSFGAVVVADELSLELEKGEALGIIGPNGAGKTTMFNLITGTLRPGFRDGDVFKTQTSPNNPLHTVAVQVLPAAFRFPSRSRV